MAIGGALWLAWLVGGPARNGKVADLVLPSGVSVTEIAARLRRARVIRSEFLFVATAEFTRAAGRLKAGEYAFAPGVSLWRVIATIAEGRIVRRQVTVPEGVTSAWVARRLASDPVLTGAVTTPPEGALLPDTYAVGWGEARSAVMARMMAARDRLLARLWAVRAPNLPYAKPEQAVTLASIVEKETALPAERPRIAGLFVNRLRAGMRLESDPTVIYGLTGGAPLGHGLRASELAATTSYNTYRTAGLPPTPIANPGRAALIAAMEPAATSDLYFVADGTGGHAFAATMAEHLKNVARWRAIESARAAGVAHER